MLQRTKIVKCLTLARFLLLTQEGILEFSPPPPALLRSTCTCFARVRRQRRHDKDIKRAVLSLNGRRERGSCKGGRELGVKRGEEGEGGRRRQQPDFELCLPELAWNVTAAAAGWLGGRIQNGTRSAWSAGRQRCLLPTW